MFIRSHRYYADIIHGRPSNELFCKKIESVQYKACLAITVAIQSTSQEKLDQELGLYSVQDW